MPGVLNDALDYWGSSKRAYKAEEDKMKRYWICYVEGSDGGEHYRHETELIAFREAERLARLPNVEGREVYVLECKGKCHIKESPVEWNLPNG